MKKIIPDQIVYYPNDVVKSNLHDYAQFRDDLSKDDRKTAVTIALAMKGIFRDFPTKQSPDFLQDLIQVRRNLSSLEKELRLATDRKSIKTARKKYSLEYREIHDAKQKLTPELAQECIEHCFEKFLEDFRNYKFIVLSRKNFMPRINEEESDSDVESPTKWQDLVSSKSTSQTSSLSSIESKVSENSNNSGGATK